MIRNTRDARMSTRAEALVPALVDENRRLKEALEHIKEIYMTKKAPAFLLEQMFETACRALHAAAEVKVDLGGGVE